MLLIKNYATVCVILGGTTLASRDLLNDPPEFSDRCFCLGVVPG